MTAPITMAKRAAAGTLALAVCLTGGVLGASAAQAAPGFAFDQRLGGADRFETAVNASQEAFADGAGDVIIVQDDALADGLTASYLAGVKEAPILYVRQNEVPAATAAELTRLGAERLFIVGGSAVVSTGVESSLRSNGRTVTRISGSDRFDTAARVATSNGNDVGTVFIANGDAPADALAAGPIAYKSNNPILLTRSMSVPASTAAALNQLNETNRIVVGGNAVVSTSTYTELDANNRLAGVNRQGTAVAIADYAVANEGFNRANAALVGPEDRNTADALIAAPLTGQTGTPILFTARDGISEQTTAYLNDNADELTGDGYVFGGTAAVSDADASAATAAAGGDGETPPPAGNEGFNITPNDAQTLVIATPDDTTDDRTYRVSDLDDSVTYRVSLVNASSVNIAADGTVTFRSSADAASASGFSVDTGGPASIISVVNGSPVPDIDNRRKSSTAQPVGGNISFTIDGEGAESVYPVIYVNGAAGNNADNGGPSPRLETQATAAGQFAETAEKYGLGGVTTYVPVEATAGSVGNDNNTVLIASVNKSANYFISGTGVNARTFFYDDNDQFRVDGRPVTLANFAASLSTGDSLRASVYADDSSLQSTFSTGDLTPAPVTGVTATAVDDTSIRVVWGPAGSAPQSYAVYRKTGAETDQLTDYTKIADVAATANPLEYVDTGLTASTQYSYAVTQTVDGDESALQTTATGAGSAATTTTSAPGVTAAPQSIAAGVTNDNSFAGIVSAGDVYTIGFNRVLRQPADGAIIRLQDGNGESVDLTNTTAADPGDTTFRLNTVAQTFQGRTYRAGTLLTVTVGTDGVSALVDRDGNTSNNNGNVDYPAQIVGQNGGITANVPGSTNPVAWNPSTSTDNTLESGAAAPVASTDATAPAVNTANYVSATQVTLTMSEVVEGSVGDGSGDGSIAAGQFRYDTDNTTATGATVAATGAALSSDGRTITLTFPTGTVINPGPNDEVVYTANTTSGGAGRVVDRSDNALGNGPTTVSGN